MSSVLRGFNLPVSTYTTSQTQQTPPTFGQQAAGLGLGALGIYGAGKGVGLFAEGGDVPDNPGIKKLAAKAPQVVEKMGFDPQEVMNAYMGGKINFQKGMSVYGDLEEEEEKESPFSQDIKNIGQRVLGRFGDVQRRLENIPIKARNYFLNPIDKPEELFKTTADKEAETKKTEDTTVPPATDKEIGEKPGPSVQDQIDSLLSVEGEKGTAMADLKKLLAEDKRDAEDAGIQQAIAGLQAVVEGENIRTGRVPLGEMGERIAGVGKSFQSIEDTKRSIAKEKIANTALLAGLEQQEAKRLSGIGAAKAEMIFNMYKLGAEQQASALEAVMGDTGGLMLLKLDMENGTNKFGELLDTIAKQISGGPRVKDGLLLGESPSKVKYTKEIDATGEEPGG
jgi:hypothetical protein